MLLQIHLLLILFNISFLERFVLKPCPFQIQMTGKLQDIQTKPMHQDRHAAQKDIEHMPNQQYQRSNETGQKMIESKTLGHLIKGIGHGNRSKPNRKKTDIGYDIRKCIDNI